MTDKQKLEIEVDCLLKILSTQPRPKRNGSYDLHDIQIPRYFARGALRRIVDQ